jgi:hypothetical protein
MARIPMTNGFTLIPEGEHIFRIYDVTYNEEFGKMVVKMVTAKGLLHNERFSLKSQDGTFNEKALNAFSYFAKTALNDFDREEIDQEELIDHYIKCVIEHTILPKNDDPTKTVTFANIVDKSPADGFEEEPVAKALNMGKAVKVDLDSALD